AFLVLKFYEYGVDYHEGLVPLREMFNTTLFSRAEEAGVPHTEYVRQVKLFFVFYYVMTGLHASHMIIGLGVLAWVMREAKRGRFTPEYRPHVENFGLYWHFVDVIWIFLLPLLYLIGGPH